MFFKVKLLMWLVFWQICFPLGLPWSEKICQKCYVTHIHVLEGRENDPCINCTFHSHRHVLHVCEAKNNTFNFMANVGTHVCSTEFHFVVIMMLLLVLKY